MPSEPPLRGVGWDHTRAMVPLHGLAQVLRDRGGTDVVHWESRPLRSFAEDPLDRFENEFDLIVYDYPFAGEALAAGWVHDLNELLPASVLADRRRDCVGRTYDSFSWDGGQAALPLDAATHVAAWRADLLADDGEVVPANWSETLALAERNGRVAMPMTPTAVWGALITLCAGGGEPPMREESIAFGRAAALAALGQLGDLARMMPAWTYASSPVALLNRMVTTDDIVFCPLTYGYSTYSMRGYAMRPVTFGDIRLESGVGGAILGGAGIGVLKGSSQPKRAAELAAWLTSEPVQSTLYAQFGGQPAAAAAWRNAFVDHCAGGFHAATRASMEACYHRPNRPGFHAFQTRSARSLQALILDGGDAALTLDAIDAGWRTLQGDGK